MTSSHKRKDSKQNDLPPGLSSIWRLCKLGYRREPQLLLYAFVFSLLAAMPDSLIAVWFARLGTGLLQNNRGRVITATDDYVADVFIDGETVAAIGKNLPMKADRTLDASNRLVIPGAIDPHVHMELPLGGTVSSDDFKTGTIAAALGGTTTIIDFAIQYKGKTFKETLDDWDARAGPKRESR